MFNYLSKGALLTLRTSLLKASKVRCFSNSCSDPQTSNVSSDHQFSVLLVTVPSIDEGKDMARKLVKLKLAACVNVLSESLSIHEWEGELREELGAMIVVKTRTSKVSKLTEYINVVNPYDISEVVSLSVDSGNPKYLKWIGETVPEN